MLNQSNMNSALCVVTVKVKSNFSIFDSRNTPTMSDASRWGLFLYSITLLFLVFYYCTIYEKLRHCVYNQNNFKHKWRRIWRHDNLVCLKAAWDLPADSAPGRQQTNSTAKLEVETEHYVSFWRWLSTLKLICWVRQWKLLLVTLNSRDEKYNTWAVWGPPKAWGPWARARRAHWIKRPCQMALFLVTLSDSNYPNHPNFRIFIVFHIFVVGGVRIHIW